MYSEGDDVIQVKVKFAKIHSFDEIIPLQISIKLINLVIKILFLNDFEVSKVDSSKISNQEPEVTKVSRSGKKVMVLKKFRNHTLLLASLVTL